MLLVETGCGIYGNSVFTFFLSQSILKNSLNKFNWRNKKDERKRKVQYNMYYVTYYV